MVVSEDCQAGKGTAVEFYAEAVDRISCGLDKGYLCDSGWHQSDCAWHTAMIDRGLRLVMPQVSNQPAKQLTEGASAAAAIHERDQASSLETQ